MDAHTPKKKLLIACLLAALAWPAVSQFAPTTNSPVIADLNRLIVQINTKLMAGKRAEADFTDNLKEFDALLTAHKGEKAADLAEVPRMKAEFYLQVLNDPEKALLPLRQIKQDFPTIQINGNTDATIQAVERMAATRKLQRSLLPGTPFPDFEEQDMNGKPLSVSAYKGKVVLIDFWATWCPPCQMELPYVAATYHKYHDQGFEVIGISLDQDRQQLERFIQARNLPWPQYCDGKFWDTKLVLKYGVSLLPTTFLLDRRGNIIAKDLRGDALEAAVAKALADK
jgi:peroxiredoxin